MQVTETLTEGLKHEFQISVPASDLDAKAGARLVDLKDKVRLNGFRPGKVPMSHLKKVYGRSVMAETVEQTIRETNSQIFTERGFKLATEPKVTLPTEENAVDDVLTGKSDLTYTVSIEVVPPIQLADFKSFSVEKPVAEVTDADVDDALKRLAEQNRKYAAKADGAKAETDDRVTINFTGSIDGTPFDGGTGEGIQVVIGTNQFIPGFEEQLVGIASGETRLVKASFPKIYGNLKLAGKDAEFETTATAVEAPQETTIDDDFAKAVGLELFDKLKDAVRQRLTQEFAETSRQRLKRLLLDQLDEAHQFEAPPSLVEEEFKQVWGTIRHEMGTTGRSFADEGTTEDEVGGGVSQDRRSPRSAWPRDVGDRREKQDHGDRRRGQPCGNRSRAFDAGTREGSLGPLSQQHECAGRASCADLRAESGRFHPRARQCDGEKGDARRAVQGR